MPMTYKRSEWGFDSRWLRTEALDNEGKTLGTIHFEPNPDFHPVAIGAECQAAPRRLSGWLRLGDRLAACLAKLLALRQALSSGMQRRIKSMVGNS